MAKNYLGPILLIAVILLTSYLLVFQFSKLGKEDVAQLSAGVEAQSIPDAQKAEELLRTFQGLCLGNITLDIKTLDALAEAAEFSVLDENMLRLVNAEKGWYFGKKGSVYMVGYNSEPPSCSVVTKGVPSSLVIKLLETKFKARKLHYEQQGFAHYHLFGVTHNSEEIAVSVLSDEGTPEMINIGAVKYSDLKTHSTSP